MNDGPLCLTLTNGSLLNESKAHFWYHSMMIDFLFTYNDKAYQAAARAFVATSGDTHYFITLVDSEFQHYLIQPGLVKTKLGGFDWPTTFPMLEAEFIKAVALGLILKIQQSK